MLHQGLEPKNILFRRVAEDPAWHVELGHEIAGNTLERFLADIQRDLVTQNEQEWSYYLAHAHGYRYEEGDLDNPQKNGKSLKPAIAGD